MRNRWWLAGYLVALVVALLSPLASSAPDGLERVAEDQGFMDRAREAPYTLIPDYLFPGLHNEALATMLAGVLGVTLTFAVAYGLALLLHRRRTTLAQNQKR